MNRYKLFIAWYIVLRNQKYGMYLSFISAIYNSKHYTVDGKYRKSK